MKKLRIFEILRNMGLMYVLYRFWYEFLRKSGLLKKRFPTEYTKKKFISCDTWRNEARPFFFKSRETVSAIPLDCQSLISLDLEAKAILDNRYRFFNGTTYCLGPNYDWVTNPQNGFKFDITKHWAEIEDISENQGDIKYVWEKSRFCYLYTIIRYDQHSGEDHSHFVYSEIMDWIKRNPLNRGPNYKCSQEISLRVLNWIFALYYYRESPELTSHVFSEIINSIVWQMHHVEKNYGFSRYTVRNNHVITESVGLFTVGLLFPFLPDAARWLKLGKRRLVQEGYFQILSDGTYIQYSMNYHRVVIQLYTWSFYLAYHNGLKFPEKLSVRLRDSINFLYQHQDDNSGELPNYGQNDGSLFFQLTSCRYRDYSPALNALNYFLNKQVLVNDAKILEETMWFSGKRELPVCVSPIKKSYSFNRGGFFTLRGKSHYAMIRCGNNKTRPSHADQLHIDVWYSGSNILRDGGTYQYNTSQKIKMFFFGTRSHNTVMLNGFDQMEKGPRFVWYKWPELIKAEISSEGEIDAFKGSVILFKHVGKNIIHERVVRQYSAYPIWIIHDTIKNTKETMTQLWNVSPEFDQKKFAFISFSKTGEEIRPIEKDGWYSSTYGAKELVRQITFTTTGNSITTYVALKSDFPLLNLSSHKKDK